MELDPKLKELMVAALIERELELTIVLQSTRVPPNFLTANALITLGIHLLEQQETPKSVIENALLSLASDYHTNGESK